MSPIRLLALVFIAAWLAQREAARYSHGWVDNVLFACFVALIAAIIFYPKKR
jgi:hypothetical protein